MAGQRVLGRVRLSRLTDESTSLERQRDIIESWVKANGHELVGWAVDPDVSGSLSPFDTPEFGKWLTDERKHEWDIVCSWKLDRIGRRVIPLNQLFGWLQDNSKTLVCVSDNIDLSTWVGRLIANVIAGVAEGELEAIGERVRSSRKKLTEVGRWPGGRPGYGHIPTKIDVGWMLTADPEAVRVINRIADELIIGRAVDWVRDELNRDGILPPSDHLRRLRGKPLKGAMWRSRSIWVMMQNRSLLGYATFNQSSVRDEDGKPVLWGEPLLSKEKFDQVQEALSARKAGPVRTRNTSPHLGISFCYDCGTQLAHRVMNRDYGKKNYRYYHCINRECPNKIMMEAEEVENRVAEHFLNDLGDEPETTRIYVPPSDNTAEIAEAREAVADVTEVLATVKSKSVKEELRKTLESLDTRIAALEMMPTREAGYRYETTGRTYGEAWNSAHTAEDRRQLLLRYGITARIKQTHRSKDPNDSGVWYFDLQVPDGLRERMSL